MTKLLPNTLETLIRMRNFNERLAMNFLQERGVISDNCVTAADVAIVDYGAACRAINERAGLTTHCKSLPS